MKDMAGAHHLTLVYGNNDRNMQYAAFFSWQVDWTLLCCQLVHFISWQVNIVTVASWYQLTGTFPQNS